MFTFLLGLIIGVVSGYKIRGFFQEEVVSVVNKVKKVFSK